MKNKKYLFLFLFFLTFSSIAFSQSIVGTWEREVYDGFKFRLIISDSTIEVKIILPNGEIEKTRIKYEVPYFVFNNRIIITDPWNGERSRFEFIISGRSLTLISLMDYDNDGTFVFEGRWTKRN